MSGSNAESPPPANILEEFETAFMVSLHCNMASLYLKKSILVYGWK